KGVVDGVVSPVETLKDFKYAQVIKYTTEYYGASYGMCFFVVMNKKKWESLPKDVQATIEKINQEWIEKQGRAWDEIGKEGREYALSKGVQFIQLTKEEDERWTKAVQPLFQEYIKSMKAKGLPGEKAVSFCREWLRKNQPVPVSSQPVQVAPRSSESTQQKLAPIGENDKANDDCAKDIQEGCIREAE